MIGSALVLLLQRLIKTNHKQMRIVVPSKPLLDMLRKNKVWGYFFQMSE